MFKRLLVLLLLVVATVSAYTPAHATTLNVDWAHCEMSYYTTSNGYYYCEAWVSGGTGSYVSHTWTIRNQWGFNYTFVTWEPYFNRACRIGEYIYVNVTVQDSAGATASRTADRVACDGKPIP